MAEKTKKKKDKILRDKLNQEVNSLYTDDYKTLVKENKGDKNKWKYSLCSWIGRVGIVKSFITPHVCVPIQWNRIETPEISPSIHD